MTSHEAAAAGNQMGQTPATGSPLPREAAASGAPASQHGRVPAEGQSAAGEACLSLTQLCDHALNMHICHSADPASTEADCNDAEPTVTLAVLPQA